jgi:hypothetical protein
MLPACRAEELLASYREARPIHPDLALLLPTSGSTGDPKMVRLSAGNLQANAEAIASTLHLSGDDRAMTSLPPNYSYGLSVINSHLLVGAALVITEASVTDPGFWRAARAGGATVLPAVPYTFELLERVGFSAGTHLPTLRLMTCAGGPLPRERVMHWAGTGAVEGWGLAVMYGQTEATARMTVLPPELALCHPDSVGRPLPAGAIEVVTPDAHGVGDIVYTGPNVMMGYATNGADLARGPEISRLHTGDRGYLRDGLLHITGRQARFAKVRGLRIDLDNVERAVAPGVCVELPERIGVVSPCDVADVLARVRGLTGLPPAAVAVVQQDLPRLENGKVDRAAAAALLAASEEQPRGSASADVRSDRLCAAYSRLLGVTAGPGDSFRSLGGDSMSYVAVSVVVERIVGDLPPDWHTRAIADLAGCPPATGRAVEVGVVLRAVGILLVVASHAAVIDIRGGAVLLMALLGHNFARFQAGRAGAEVARSAAWLLTPALVWVAGVVLLTQTYSAAALGWAWLAAPVTDTPDWRYWFVGAMVWILPVVALLHSVPVVRRALRARPFAAPFVATCAALLLAQVMVPAARPSSLFSPWAVLWVFLLGWTVTAADDTRRRMAVSALVIGASMLSFEGSRLWVVPLGLLLLIWVRQVRLPTAPALLLAGLAQGSLFIYLSHWQVLEVFRNGTAVAASLLLGLLLAAAWTLAVPAVRSVGWPGAALRIPVPRLRADVHAGPADGAVRGPGLLPARAR